MHNFGQMTVKETDIDGIRRELESENDRAAALVSCSILEAVLKSAVASRLFLANRKLYDGLFEDMGAPLSSFSSRIKVGRALGIYGGQTQDALDKIRKVRNLFAHELRPLLFTDKQIEILCTKLPHHDFKWDDGRSSETRNRYVGACFKIGSELSQYALRHSAKPKTIFTDLP